MKLLRHIYLLSSACFDNAVGVSSPGIIPDSFLRASTTMLNGWFQPAYARLDDSRGGGWCARDADDTPNDWLQIDFGKIIEVCGVATQGNGYEWVTEFKLSFSFMGDTWETYKDIHGINMVRFISLIVKNGRQLGKIFPLSQGTF